MDGSEVIYKKGVLLEIVEGLDPKKSHLLIIDEINRANLNQVFGEVIQCLDRSYTLKIRAGLESKDFCLPENLFILGTMNSSDRSVGGIDHAVRRRFMHIYCPPTPNLLKDLCAVSESFSLEDFLSNLNGKLLDVLKNKELAIGHAIFLKTKLGTSVWSLSELEILFNHKILPIIEEFCNGDQNKIVQIVGKSLSRRPRDEDFLNAMIEYSA